MTSLTDFLERAGKGDGRELSLETFKRLCPYTWKKSDGEPFSVEESITRQAFVAGFDTQADDLKKLIEIVKVMRFRLEDIKEIQEHLGGESVLLDDVNETLKQAEAIARGEG